MFRPHFATGTRLDSKALKSGHLLFIDQSNISISLCSFCQNVMAPNMFSLLQLNISFPATGCQKLIEVDDERKLRTFYEKRMATEVAADPLGDEWKVGVIAWGLKDTLKMCFCDSAAIQLAWWLHILKVSSSVFSSPQGYVVRISGGNDKQGFPMKQGVLTTGRVRLLLSKGHSCYRPRRTGERKRKSVRGCFVDANLSVLNLVIVRKGNIITQATLLCFCLCWPIGLRGPYCGVMSRAVLVVIVIFQCYTLIGSLTDGTGSLKGGKWLWL